MTVQQLIEKLESYPEDLDVEILDGPGSVEIERLFLDNQIIDLGPGRIFARLSVDRELVVIVPEGAAEAAERPQEG